MKKIILSLIVLSAIYGIYKFSNLNDTFSHSETIVTVGKASVSVEIADTPTLQELGLSGRTSLEETKGMLFVFPVPDTYGFWMKNMKFPIDIIWAVNGRVVSIKKSVYPASYPEVFYPTEASKYVLEVTSGFSDQHDLKVGDSFFVGS